MLSAPVISKSGQKRPYLRICRHNADTEDSPLINASMPGCPFRMTSYTGPAMVDSDTRYGLQLHQRFLVHRGSGVS